MIRTLLLAVAFVFSCVPFSQANPLVYEGDSGIGKGKHIVFLAGDHEYRSEESLPALARILAKHHGFKCTVLFSIDKKTGEIAPGSSYMPGTEALKTADLMVIFLRFQDFPKEQMQPIVDYLERGGPVVGMRTSTHAFKIPNNSEFARFSYNYKGDDYPLGFGRQVLGETWAGHYGKNHVMSTRLDIVPEQKDHPVLRGVKNPWVQAGGYWTEPMEDSTTLAMAQPLETMQPDAPAAKDKNSCPGVWVRNYQSKSGNSGRVFTTTYGASEDLLNEGFRRMMVNGCLWAAGMEQQIKPNLKVDFVGPYQPVTFSFGGHRKGVKPAELTGWDSPILPDHSQDDKKKETAMKAPRREQGRDARRQNSQDAKNTKLENPPKLTDEDFSAFAIYEKTAPRPKSAEPIPTSLPLQLKKGDRIALIGNTLFERSQDFGHFEAMLQKKFPQHQLAVRHLAWSADAIDVQPRPDNFADTQQHLVHEKADVILAAFGFNESFAGPAGLADFRQKLSQYLTDLKSKSFNGETAARIVLVSPIANENLDNIPAASLNNANIQLYVDVMREVAAEQKVAFANVFPTTAAEMDSPGTDLTINGVHLNRVGDQVFSAALFKELFQEEAPEVSELLLDTIVDKNTQFFRRFRPLNTFYYTGGRNKDYGYLDFLPAMRNFDMMVSNRDQRIWDIAQGKQVPEAVDDSNVPPLPMTKQSRGANEWMSAEDEKKAFDVDPRFEVNLFAGEEQFPDIVNPIQMRWDSKGRLWVSCSTTYPHVYPGNEPKDKLVILEDTDGDGKADKSTVFADNLHIPLSFEFGDGGVYVSEQPCLSFLQDTDGDDKADVHKTVLRGFGTEDSHHSLHDFTWTPDGDLIFRESIFHHSQVETPYGPVRQQNSGWFRFDPKTQRLISFGTYPSTNPWGVTFDRWGQHMASHPVYAEAHQAVDPPYPLQNDRPNGLQAYSGVCGHHFVDWSTFPKDLQGSFIKVRYKPTNRVEILNWKEGPYGYTEEYVGDLLFSRNLSFIPVDLQWGPRGALYVCDWYNPIKGHAQYSLRDERRDRHSGRIWRITAKDMPLQDPPKIADASIAELLELLKRPEYAVRFMAKRELGERDPAKVKRLLDSWVTKLDPSDPEFRHHQIEAIWTYRWIDVVDMVPPSDGTPERDLAIAASVLEDLLACDDPHARAAATKQLRYWYPYIPRWEQRLKTAANDENGIVRMQAAIAATYIGSKPAFTAMLDVLKHPREGHVAYGITCALMSKPMRAHWEGNPRYGIARILKQAAKDSEIKEPKPTVAQAKFDAQKDLREVKISCLEERMLFDVKHFMVKPGQPLKIVFTNPDATDHNFVIVKPDALAEVGMAANEMAKDPTNADSDFIPREKMDLIIENTPMIGPTRSAQIAVLRFHAPKEEGIYPYVCTFPGHWVVMNGVMVVAQDDASAQALMDASVPQVTKEWKMTDFADFVDHPRSKDDAVLVRGMTAFVKARCNQCHVVAGHGTNLGPDLTESVKKLKGKDLLQQMVDPSSQINEKFQNVQFLTIGGRVITGVVVKEDKAAFHVATNLLTPNSLTTIPKDDVEQMAPSKISPMPGGLLNTLTKEEIYDLHSYLEAGGYEMPEHLKHLHDHGNHEKAK
ncbi:Auracyanin-A precursor [Bremerella volcania]|uniref:Auracyanin-A n=1 Tax=Bremerella volcania TaxID=2527984 RepID=A0A518CBZ6_9BACT|nr:PVC-type heme-binding CxxCH protein [Bremerella volcania]QDU76743.1 Auracyanin-A precursor [Bremerella volcania]